jgi:deoxyribonuclease IV
MAEHTSPLLVGAHTSAAGGPYRALLEGVEIGATTIQLFTANQRQWIARPLTEEMLSIWKTTREQTGLSHLMSHASYLINMGAPDPEMLQKSRTALCEEFTRCEQLGLTYLNFHPGAALQTTRESCLDRIVEGLLLMRAQVEKGTVRLLLETTAGQGSCVGCKFEELAYIISRVEHEVPIGVCLDTCHVFVSGYDMSSAAACEETFAHFDAVIGLKHLYALHLNDSLKGLNSRLDRHRPLGAGCIGWPCFEYLVRSPRTRHLAMYLETPDGPPLWKNEITMLRQLSEAP